MSAAAAIEVRNLRRAFGRRLVLEDVTFDLGRGVLASIEGENGSGKSTLLRVVVGLLAPGAGKVTVRGRVGYCPQEPQVFDALTVGEHFRYFGTAYGLPRDVWRASMEALLERFRFARYEGFLVSQLSGGTRQKLNLALALLHDPDLLVLDEPYAGFDWETYLRFWEVAAQLKERGKTILVVSHLVYDRAKFDARFRLAEGVLRCA
jgi:ABC-type multidrug transport system ATPase subunit